MFRLYPHCVFANIVQKGKEGLWKPVLDCSSGLNCSMTSCLKLLQQQPTVVHPQLRAGRELALNYGLLLWSLILYRRKQSVTVYSHRVTFAIWSRSAGQQGCEFCSHHSCSAHQCVRWRGEETSVGTPRAVVPLRGRAKMWHSLAKTLQLSFLKDTVAFSLWQSSVWVKMTDSYWYSLGIFTIGRQNWSWASAELWDDVCCISL